MPFFKVLLAKLQPGPSLTVSINALSRMLHPDDRSAVLLPAIRALSLPSPLPSGEASPDTVFALRWSAIELLLLVPSLQASVLWDQAHRFCQALLRADNSSATQRSICVRMASLVESTRGLSELQNGEAWTRAIAFWAKVAGKVCRLKLEVEARAR